MSLKAGYLMPHPPVLVAEVGNGREEICKKTIQSYEQLSQHIAAIKPKRIIVITPHGPMFSDGCAISAEPKLVGDLGGFGAPEVAIEKRNDTKFVDELVYESGKIDIPVVKIDQQSAKLYKVSTNLDHGAIVPLYFVDKAWSDYSLVHITYGLLSIPKLYHFGMLIQSLLEKDNTDTVFIASGDLSHCLKDGGPYEYRPEGPVFDKMAVEYLNKGLFKELLTIESGLIKRAGECAYRSLAVLGGVLDGCVFDSEILSYEGPFGVGYGVGWFKLQDGKRKSLLVEISEERMKQIKNDRLIEDPWVALARQSVESYVTKGIYIDVPGNIPEELLNDQHGVFVSIKGPSGLRGCIGTIVAMAPCVAKEIIENAVKACSQDPRFSPIEEDELQELIISVDVLMDAEPIESIAELDPEKYGVIVNHGVRRGLLLPDLDGVDTPEEQVRIALNKAGISEKEKYSLERFEVVRHG